MAALPNQTQSMAPGTGLAFIGYKRDTPSSVSKQIPARLALFADWGPH
jgi:hypothetical protein